MEVRGWAKMIKIMSMWLLNDPLTEGWNSRLPGIKVGAYVQFNHNNT